MSRSRLKGYKTFDVITPKEGQPFISNMYWLCKDGDPKQALFYNGTIQGNKDRRIPERLIGYTKEKTGWNVKIVFIKKGWRPNVFS